MSNEMIANGVTEKLAAWLIAQSYEDMPDAVKAKAVEVVFDSVGAMTACSTLPEVKAIVELMNEQGSRGDCTIIGHAGSTSVINAAMCNGGMAHGNEGEPVHATS